MKQIIHRLSVQTRGRGLYDVTGEVAGFVEDQSIHTGLATLFLQHTSASLVIQENADPDVLRDLDAFFCRLVREDESLYRHTTEGPDDMPSHVRAALTQTQLSIPVHDGRLALGTWQGVYVFEHRTRPHRRNIVVHVIGE